MKDCPPGKYYCNKEKKCMPIPRGYYVGARGWLKPDPDDDNGRKSKKNGNKNGNGHSGTNGSNTSNGNGNGNGSNGGGGMSSEDWKPEIEHVKGSDLRKKAAEKKRKEAADSLPPHLRLDVMKKAFSSANEEASYKQRDKALKKSKKAMDYRHKTIHKGGDDDVNEGSSMIYVGKKGQYHGPRGDHRRDKEGNIVASHYKKKPSPTGEKYGDKSNRPKTPKPADVRKRTKKGETARSALNRAKKYEREKVRVYQGDAKRKAAKTGEYAKGFNEASQVNEVIGQFAGGNPGTDMAMNMGMKMNPLLGAVKQKAKKEVKQKSAEVTGNVADKISKPIGGTRVQESKGTAELAGLALRGKKRCAECGSFTHVTGDCPKKEHGLVNKRTVTSEEKKYPYGKASKNNPRGKRDQAELDRAQDYIKKNPNFGRERSKKDQAELDRAQSYIKKHPKFGLKKEDVNEGREERSGKDNYLPFKVCYDGAEPYVLYARSVAEIKIELRKIYRPENHKKIYVKRLYPNEVIKLYYDLRQKALTNQ